MNKLLLLLQYLKLISPAEASVISATYWYINMSDTGEEGIDGLSEV